LENGWKRGGRLELG
jgi:hypothetical protein